MATSNSVYRLRVVLVSLVKEDCENDRVEHIHYHIIVMGNVSCSGSKDLGHYLHTKHEGPKTHQISGPMWITVQMRTVGSIIHTKLGSFTQIPKRPL